ncbi:MAG: hypothetical protein U1E76_03515 [Planctomycetota bacterium]
MISTNVGVAQRALQRCEHVAHLGVHRRDLPLVGAAREARPERLERLVREVRIEVVDPGEERRSRAREPLEEFCRGGAAAPLVQRASVVGGAVRRQAIVVIESLIEPELRLEHERRDERSGVVAGSLQRLGHGDVLGREPEQAVVAHAMLVRVEPGEDRGMRRRGQRTRGVRVLEAHAARCQPIDHRRHFLRAAVAAELVGARRVERDQDEVPGRRARLAAAREHHAEREKKHAHHGIPAAMDPMIIGERGRRVSPVSGSSGAASLSRIGRVPVRETSVTGVVTGYNSAVRSSASHVEASITGLQA